MSRDFRGLKYYLQYRFKYLQYTYTMAICAIIFIFVASMLAACGRKDGAAASPASAAPVSTAPALAAPVSTYTSVAPLYRRISAKEAKDIIDKDKKAVILDVRTQSEYDEGHIDGSMLLPLDEIAAKAKTVLPDKNAVILVYCRSGNRSKTAAEELIRQGYTGVSDFGGIIDWPYGTVK